MWPINWLNGLHGVKARSQNLAVEATRVTLEVLERTIFSDGLGRAPEDIRLAMKNYFEICRTNRSVRHIGGAGFCAETRTPEIAADALRFSVCYRRHYLSAP